MELNDKIYWIKIQNIFYKIYKNVKKAKGIKNNKVEKKLHLNDYIDCLFNKKIKYIKQNLFGNKNHDIFAAEQKRNELNCHDNMYIR